MLAIRLRANGAPTMIFRTPEAIGGGKKPWPDTIEIGPIDFSNMPDMDVIADRLREEIRAWQEKNEQEVC